MNHERHLLTAAELVAHILRDAGVPPKSTTLPAKDGWTQDQRETLESLGYDPDRVESYTFEWCLDGSCAFGVRLRNDTRRVNMFIITAQ